MAPETCEGGPDTRVLSFLERPMDGEWPYLWLDATYIKVRQDGRIVFEATWRNMQKS